MQLFLIPTNPKILIYGYGLEGQSSESWLMIEFPNSKIEVYEDGKGLSVEGKKISDSVDFLAYDLIVKSPGVPPSSIPDFAWSKVTSNLRLFLENLTETERSKVIGITGSKGKSTTAKFTHELLQNSGLQSTIIGNYGVPALDIWSQLNGLDYIVAECSSFQLYDLKVSPKYAIFLSFFADHLDWHNNSKIDYLAAKSNLWKHQTSTDYWFLPHDIWNRIQTINVPSVHYICTNVSGKLFPANSTLQAAHFRQNFGTVWSLAEVLKLPNLAAAWKSTAL